MKLLTIYSESHKCLLENHFLPSVPDEFDVVAVNSSQRGSGHYEDEGFRHATQDKLVAILEMAEKSVEPFVYADCDIRFNPNLNMLGRINSLLEVGADIIAQRDWGAVCTGFMVIIPNDKNKRYLKATIDYMELPQNSNRLIDFHDQLAFNELYRSDLFPNVPRPKVHLVDGSSGFGNLNHFKPGVIWNPTDNFFANNHASLVGQCLWHANFTVGVENKMFMLDQYRDNVVIRYYKNARKR
jgi:hypothetical protein